MNWTDLIKEICARTGLPQDQVKDVMGAQREIVLEALARGEDVPLAGVGTLGSRWQEARTLRSLQEQRKIMIDGRFIARFRPGKQIRDVLLSRTPQLWREPSHQAAWRISETLVGDLNLYHGDRAPAFSPDAPMDTVQKTCEASFGPLWNRVIHAYESQVPAAVRAQRTYLLIAARRRWSAER